jgi:hypothetical protein
VQYGEALALLRQRVNELEMEREAKERRRVNTERVVFFNDIPVSIFL